jgi:hypothetical protein
MGVSEPSENALNVLPLAAGLLQWGPVTLHPSVSYTFSYADGILNSPGHPESSIINEFSTTLLAVIGSHWTFSYTPSWSWYSSKSFSDTLNHSLALNGFTAYGDWTFGLSQTYNLFSGPLVETGTQTEQQNFGTTLSASYLVNSKVSLDLALMQNYESASSLQSYRQWSTMDYVNYQFWPRFSAGLGAGFGYVDSDPPTPNMTYEQFQGRISWRATEKSSLLFHGGLEYRQFLSGGSPPLLNPVFGLAFQTQLLRHTSLALIADHTVSASYFEAQVSESSSLGLSLSQALSQKFSLSLGTSYSTVSYTSALNSAPRGGYSYVSFTSRLTYTIIPRGTLYLTYQFSDNYSSEPGLSFTSNQVGIGVGYSF